MYWLLMIICCFAWGALAGYAVRNPFLALVLGGVGGFAIGQLFQSAGLL